jgi:sterol desaturase/sphingolipid hydroxylase (fatty acid hydroxylase superfamily)
MLRRALPYVAYPMCTVGAVCFCLWALARAWPAWLIGAAVVTVMSAVVAGLELVIPYSKTWARSRGDLRADVWHYLVSNRAFDVGVFVAVAVCAPLGARISLRSGRQLWPHHWPLGAQALLALVLVELPWYFIHRLEHRWEPLWRVHSVHHSSERIYWLNLARNHPIDNALSALASTAPLALLGVREAPLALMAAFSGAHGMLQHSNVDLRTGPLDVVLATARVHRWHHSTRREEADANYCPTITLWDWVFGTRRFDATRAPPEAVGLGADGLEFPRDYKGQLGVPFDAARWDATRGTR